MKTKLITLMAGVAVAGAASAAIHIDEAFNYPDGPISEIMGLHTGAGLTGVFTDAGWNSLSGVIDAGGITGQDGPAIANTLSSIPHVVGDNSVVWMSYRCKMNGSSSTAGGVLGITYGPESYRGIGLKLGPVLDDTWKKWSPSVSFGQTQFDSTNAVVDLSTPEGPDADLFLIAKAIFSDPPHISCAVYDSSNIPTTEASIVWDIEEDVTNHNGRADGDYGLLVISQTTQASVPTKYDNILVGDSFADVDGVYPPPTMAPTAPTSLDISGISASEVYLTWTDTSTEEEGFIIERSLDGTTYSVVANNSRNATAFLDSGLTSDTTYYYRVSATNSQGASATTSGSGATFAPQPPIAPSDLSATRTSQIEIGLTWTDNAADEDVYIVERKTDGDFSTLAILPANDTSYADTGLDTGETYTYRVAATNAFGYSIYTAEQSATTTSDPVAPSSGLIISATETEYLLDFDNDLPGVYMANVGNFTSNNVVEPDNDARSLVNPNRGASLFSESVAVAHKWWTGVQGGETGGATRFLADGDLSSSTENLIGFQSPEVQGMSDAAGSPGNYSYKMSDQWLVGGFFLRIKNTTGGVVSNWNFAVDAYYDQVGGNSNSVLQLFYAVDGSANPDVMKWTSFGTTVASSTSNVISTIAGTLGGDVTTTPVPAGGYIVLQVKETTDAAGKTYLDNIKVTAYGPPDPYDTWSKPYGLVEGPDGDDDGDNMSNFYEYALNGNPTNAADTGVTYGDDGVGFFSYIHGKRLNDASLVYTLEDTDDLIHGSVNTNGWDSQTSGSDPSDPVNYDAITNNYNMTGKSQLFIKLIIE